MFLIEFANLAYIHDILRYQSIQERRRFLKQLMTSVKSTQLENPVIVVVVFLDDAPLEKPSVNPTLEQNVAVFVCEDREGDRELIYFLQRHADCNPDQVGLTYAKIYCSSEPPEICFGIPGWMEPELILNLCDFESATV